MGARLKKFVSSTLTVVLFLTQAVFAHSLESNIWASRQRSVLPLQLPSLNTADSSSSSLLGAVRSRLKSNTPIDAAGRLRPISFQDGLVREVFHASTGDTSFVYLIQDIHQHHEAQGHIAAMLESIAEWTRSRGETFLIGVEAAFQPFNLDRFHSFSNTRIKNLLAEYFLREGEIAAPSYVAMRHPQRVFSIVGVDHPGHYRANVEAYRRSHLQKSGVESGLRQMRYQLEQEKSRIFGTDLLAWDRLRGRLDRNELTLGGYLADLSRRIDAPLIVEQFLAAYELEKSLDLALVETERQRVVHSISSRLPEPDLKALLAEGVAYQAGNSSSSHYYRAIQNAAIRAGLDASSYPSFQKYIQLVLLADGIRPEALFQAQRDMEKELIDSFRPSAPERALLNLSRWLTLADRLVDFSLIPADWAEYRQLAEKASVWKRNPDILTRLRPFEEFYRQADIRSRVMIERLLAQMKGAKLSAVVVGGFHTPHMTELLRSKGVSHAVVQPKITAIESEGETAYLSLFDREKTPLQRIVEGQKLFLGPVSAGFGANASPTQNVKILGSEAALSVAAGETLPAGSGITTRGSRDLQELTFGPEAVTLPVSVGKELSRAAWSADIPGLGTVSLGKINPVPETVAVALSVLAHPLGLNSWEWTAWLILASVMVRIIWTLSIAAHALGHAGMRWAVDRDHPFSWDDVTNELRPGGVWSLVPFTDIRLPSFTPGTSVPTGDDTPWKVSLKAFNGPLASVVLAALGYAAIFAMPDEGGILVGGALFVTSALWVVTSFSDYAAAWTGFAPAGLFCGVFVMIGKYLRADTGILPERYAEALRMMGLHTQVRGKQAGGGLFTAIDKNGHHNFIGTKAVNPKRSNLTDLIITRLNYLVAKMTRRGWKQAEQFIAFFHWRFGTSSAPSELETHWHEWMAPENEDVWRQDQEGNVAAETVPVNFRIVHNGDFDGLEHNDFLGIFGQRISVAQVGLALNRTLAPNKTKGDSPKLAGMMAIFSTQGRWYASVRLAHLLDIQRSFINAFPDAESLQEIQQILRVWTEVMERQFEKHRDRLYPHGSRRAISNPDPVALRAFIADSIEALAPEHNAMTGRVDPKKRRAFVESAVYNFMNNDMAHALQMVMVTPQNTSTFGFSCVSTLEPDRIVVAAKGQPITIGAMEDGALVASSESAAAFAVSSRFMDLDSANGEIAVLKTTGLDIFSFTERRWLESGEIEDRWVDVDGNPYIERPKPPVENEDVVKADLNDVAAVATLIRDDFREELSWNRRTSDALMELLVEKSREQEAWKAQKTKLAQTLGMDLPDEMSAEADLVLIAEEKSERVALNWKKSLAVAFPKLHVVLMTGNEYLAQASTLHDGRGPIRIGKKSIVFSISQSGETFPTLNATRALMKKKASGEILDVFVMTGRIYSEMGKAVGQEYRPDSDFSERIFSNMSGRRRSEAATVATLAADFTLTQILTHMCSTMIQRFPGERPYGMTITPEGLGYMKRDEHRLVNTGIRYITGMDAAGVSNENSPVYRNLLAKADLWADHILEPLTVLTAVRIYTFFSVLLGKPLFQSLVLAIGGLIFFSTGVSATFLTWAVVAIVLRVLDALLYTFQDLIFAYVLRKTQGRTILDRTGGRTIVIASPMWELVRNYASRLFAEAPGYLQPKFDGRESHVGIVNDLSPDVVRGTLIYGHLDDSSPLTTPKKQRLSGTLMSYSQSDGIRNFGVGPDILLSHFDPSQDYRFNTVALRHTPPEEDRRAALLAEDDPAHELVSLRYRNMEMLLSSYVFFWAMAKTVSEFRVSLGGRNKGRWIMAVLAPVSVVFRFVFIRSYSLFSRFFFGGSRRLALWMIGFTQSGAGTATTQTVPGIGGNAAGGEERDIKQVATKIRESGIPGRTWVPTSPDSRIPYFLAHFSNPNRNGSTHPNGNGSGRADIGGVTFVDDTLVITNTRRDVTLRYTGPEDEKETVITEIALTYDPSKRQFDSPQGVVLESVEEGEIIFSLGHHMRAHEMDGDGEHAHAWIRIVGPAPDVVARLHAVMNGSLPHLDHEKIWDSAAPLPGSKRAGRSEASSQSTPANLLAVAEPSAPSSDANNGYPLVSSAEPMPAPAVDAPVTAPVVVPAPVEETAVPTVEPVSVPLRVVASLRPVPVVAAVLLYSVLFVYAGSLTPGLQNLMGAPAGLLPASLSSLLSGATWIVFFSLDVVLLLALITLPVRWVISDWQLQQRLSVPSFLRPFAFILAPVHVIYAFGFRPVDRLARVMMGDELPDAGRIERMFSRLPVVLQVPLLPFTATFLFLLERLPLYFYVVLGQAFLSDALPWAVNYVAMAQGWDTAVAASTTHNILNFNVLGQGVIWLGTSALAAVVVSRFSVMGIMSSVIISLIAVIVTRAIDMARNGTQTAARRFTELGIAVAFLSPIWVPIGLVWDFVSMRGVVPERREGSLIHRSLVSAWARRAWRMHWVPVEIELVKFLGAFFAPLNTVVMKVEGDDGILGAGRNFSSAIFPPAEDPAPVAPAAVVNAQEPSLPPSSTREPLDEPTREANRPDPAAEAARRAAERLASREAEIQEARDKQEKFIRDLTEQREMLESELKESRVRIAVLETAREQWHEARTAAALEIKEQTAAVQKAEAGLVAARAEEESLWLQAQAADELLQTRQAELALAREKLAEVQNKPVLSAAERAEAERSIHWFKQNGNRIGSEARWIDEHRSGMKAYATALRGLGVAHQIEGPGTAHSFDRPYIPLTEKNYRDVVPASSLIGTVPESVARLSEGDTSRVAIRINQENWLLLPKTDWVLSVTDSRTGDVSVYRVRGGSELMQRYAAVTTERLNGPTAQQVDQARAAVSRADANLVQAQKNHTEAHTAHESGSQDRTRRESRVEELKASLQARMSREEEEAAIMPASSEAEQKKAERLMQDIETKNMRIEEERVAPLPVREEPAPERPAGVGEEPVSAVATGLKDLVAAGDLKGRVPDEILAAQVERILFDIPAVPVGVAGVASLGSVEGRLAVVEQAVWSSDVPHRENETRSIQAASAAHSGWAALAILILGIQRTVTGWSLAKEQVGNTLSVVALRESHWFALSDVQKKEFLAGLVVSHQSGDRPEQTGRILVGVDSERTEADVRRIMGSWGRYAELIPAPGVIQSVGDNQYELRFGILEALLLGQGIKLGDYEQVRIFAPDSAPDYSDVDGSSPLRRASVILLDEWMRGLTLSPDTLSRFERMAREIAVKA